MQNLFKGNNFKEENIYLIQFVIYSLDLHFVANVIWLFINQLISPTKKESPG